jgi:PAS domain S-box-containing protein
MPVIGSPKPPSRAAALVHARFARALRRAPMIVWMAGADGGNIFVNRKWLAFTGQRPRDARGNGWSAAVHPDDVRACLDAYLMAVAEQRPVTVEYRLRRFDGVYRTVADCAFPIHDDDGEFAGYVGACLDVSEQREESAAALERTLAHLTLVGAHADEMIYRLRVTTAPFIDYISPGITRIIGITPEEFRAAPDEAAERLHPDDRAKARALRTAPPDSANRTILRWVHPDGRIVWAEHRRLPVFDSHGNLIAIDGIARDITRQVELEHERDAQIAVLDGLIAHMNDGVFAETDAGSVAVVNASFCRLFGIARVPDDATAAEVRALVTAQLSNPVECCQPADGGDGRSPAVELRTRDERILEQVHFSVPFEAGRMIHVWQFRDITHRKREEEDLRLSRHRLRDLSAHLEAAREEERRELARTLHDEVGQLLTGIRLEVASAVERFRTLGSAAEFPIVDRLQAAVGLVDLSIATVQRVTSALRPPVLEHLGLVSAIRWEAAVFRRRTGIRCRVSSGHVHVDDRTISTVLYRILLEALTNVARHAHAGTVWISVKERPGRVTMEVCDNGKGISDEMLRNPATMGLLGMKERALAAGGEVRISRRPTGGTSVQVTLPLPDTTSKEHLAGHSNA